MAVQELIHASGASTLINKAVEFVQEGKLREALVHYLAAVDALIELREEAEGDDKLYLYGKVDEYLSRAELIMDVVKEKMKEGYWHEQYKIEFDSDGHSYEDIFRRFCTFDLTEITLEDSYIRTPFQISNFVSLCEVLVSSGSPITKIKLITGQDLKNAGARKNQEQSLQELTGSLKDKNIVLEVDYSSVDHDREIKFDNGWYLKIGRGLDIFKNPGKYSLGASDQLLRKCLKTTVDIFHKDILRLI